MEILLSRQIKGCYALFFFFLDIIHSENSFNEKDRKQHVNRQENRFH